MQNIDLRILKEEELPLLPRGLTPDEHEGRFSWQQAGKALYLIAWQGTTFLGHLMLVWEGENVEPIRSSLSRCPNISNFYVVSEYRSQSIGSHMLDWIESAVRWRGYEQIGLGVAIENTRAQALYARRGYRDSGLGEYADEWEWFDDEGKVHVQRDICIYMIKPLPLEETRKLFARSEEDEE